MTAIQISDPIAHPLYSCFPHDAKKRCHFVTYTPSPSTVFNFQGQHRSSLPMVQAISLVSI
jgi:hypothetical protein